MWLADHWLLTIAAVVLVVAVILAIRGWRAFWKSEERKTLAEYLGGVAVVMGILTALLQQVQTQSNLNHDTRLRTEQEVRRQYMDAAKMLGDPQLGPRIAAIYAMGATM